ncbi:uncharacterized protein LOC144005473 [Festucalex cinctus]
MTTFPDWFALNKQMIPANMLRDSSGSITARHSEGQRSPGGRGRVEISTTSFSAYVCLHSLRQEARRVAAHRDTWKNFGFIAPITFQIPFFGWCRRARQRRRSHPSFTHTPHHTNHPTCEPPVIN